MKEFDFSETNTLEDLEAKVKNSGIRYNLELIKKASEYAKEHLPQEGRKSGKSWLSHCLSVAGYVIELRLDTVSVVCAILHDVVEKGDGDIEEIDKLFGTEVSFIVEGSTKVRELSKNYKENEQRQEDFNNLIFNSSEDIRIIIVRLLEKLHNLLTVNLLSREDQIKSATKILKIYSPIAEYLGLGIIQRRMEDEAFKILYPEEYTKILNAIDEFLNEQKDVIAEFEAEFLNILKKYGVENVQFSARKKGIYSAYKKIYSKYVKQKGLTFDEALEHLKDIYAGRVIVESIKDCYMVLGLVQSNFITLREEFVDYIAHPKENGYQSIHTLFEYQNTVLELQIRTYEMHEFNEYGPASHIAYKLQKSSNNESYTWTKELVTWKDKDEVTKQDFKIKAFQKSIFVFTPKGLVIRLQKDSGPLDFAFKIHTKLGLKYRGALVNGKMVSMDHNLKTGDVVEILSTKGINVTSDWLKVLKSTASKAQVRKYLKRK